MLQAILFDLDDTLYEERQFFHSGFVAMAALLESRGAGPAARSVELLNHLHHHEGREGVLQKLAVSLPFPVEWIADLVDAFHSHVPLIQLADDAKEVLPRLRQTHKLGCVTDGWAAVQRAKLKALGVESLLDAVVVTDDYGRDRWKPHPFPFHKCCELLAADPAKCLYVGDNPQRDLIGARNAGLRFVRIRRHGGYFERVESSSAESTSGIEVQNLVELEQQLSQL